MMWTASSSAVARRSLSAFRMMSSAIRIASLMEIWRRREGFSTGWFVERTVSWIGHGSAIAVIGEIDKHIAAPAV
jgi:hypothetical protein